MRAEIPEDRLLWLTVLRRALEQVLSPTLPLYLPYGFPVFRFDFQNMHLRAFAGERCFPGYPPRQCRDRGQKRQQQQRR